MSRNDWAKDLLFLSLATFALGALGLFLLKTETVATPSSFSPDSESQLAIVAVARQVDRAFDSDRADAMPDLKVADRADDLLIARRLSLGLMSTLPSVEEIREFESRPEDERLHWWISRLLEDRRTSNQLAERLARAFVGVTEGEFVIFRRRRFVKWLSDRLHENYPYDRLVHNILTNEGLWTDEPSTNFYTKAVANEPFPDPIILAGRTSRAMLGMRIDCLQCHDDFLGTINLGSATAPEGGMQTDFHSLAAFFARSNLSLVGVRDSGDKEYMYKLLDEDEESLIEPSVPFNRELVDENETKLTKRLADWVTHPENRPFARSIVNRMWAIMCGKPIIEPVDDIPLEGPFPAAMETLVDDLIANDFDLHRLIRIIAESETYRRDSKAGFEITSDHEEHWATFPLARLRPDQVAGAIVQSTSLKTIDSTAHIIEQLTKFGEQFEFVERFGDAGEDEFVARGETVTQRLLMLNGKMVDERLENPLYSPMHIAGLSPSHEKSVETIYLSTLCRRPTEEELEFFVGRLKGKYGNERQRKIQDIYWTLINSIEFVWNH